MAEKSAQEKSDHALAILDGMADNWAEEVNLTAMIKNAVSPMGLNRNAPDDVRQKFTDRMEAQIYAIARQGFIEGAYRAITGLQDEQEEMKRCGIDPADVVKAAAARRPLPFRHEVCYRTMLSASPAPNEGGKS